ncbi:hypothetical protein H6503_00600 [Candidatus Woesearchaeota archaeon]|nr:hypothetical protein [Candidatus Woesearchaeota archaeon]
MRMMSLQWPVVLVTTVVLYALVIFCLPINPVYATVFLFTLIGFWSRLPGAGIPHPMFLLYNLDVVDVFAVIIAINVGGPQAALFALFTNIWSRVCGVFPTWMSAGKDAIFQAMLCLVLPFVFAMTQSLVITTIFFTIGRSILYLTIGMLVPHNNFATQVWVEIQFQASLLAINIFYVSLFGNFFGNLLQEGVSFSWPLFLFATTVIVAFYMIFYRKKSRKKSNLAKKVVRKILQTSERKPSIMHDDAQDMKFVRESLERKM